jgi:hypothetical protein
VVNRNGHVVRVHIHLFADTEDEWALEVVGQDGSCTVWDDTFRDDVAAYEAFESAIAEDGLGSFSNEKPAGH